MRTAPSDTSFGETPAVPGSFIFVVVPCAGPTLGSRSLRVVTAMLRALPHQQTDRSLSPHFGPKIFKHDLNQAVSGIFQPHLFTFQ